MKHQHGGNTSLIAAKYGLEAGQLIDFSVNLNPLGPPPGVVQALSESLPAVIAYPEPDSRGLRESGALWLGVAAEQLLFANGAVELIYLLVQALMPRVALIPAPTFTDYEEAAHLYGARVKHLRLSAARGFQPKLEQLIKAARGAEIVFLCNPNNPTGTLYAPELLDDFLEFCNHEAIFLVVDESFLPFQPRWRELSLARKTCEYKNLLVLQSLTKFFAIAGLRVGCAIAHPAVINFLEQRQTPWQVNGLAQTLTPLCFQDEDYARRTREYLAGEREWLGAALAKLPGIRVYPSEAAYFLLQLEPPLTAAGVTAELAQRGIMVRDASNFAFLDGRYLRVAVKDRELNQLLVANLKDICQPESPHARWGSGIF